MTKRSDTSNIYGGADPRELPAYTLVEAAHHLRLKTPTLGTWCRGRGRMIVPAKTAPTTFSFFNLMEAHVLAAICRKHKIPLVKVRKALNYVETTLEKKRPLIEQAFRTNGVDLFVEVCDQIVSASENGQLYIRDTIELALERVEHDSDGLVARLHPWAHDLTEPKLVVIDPRRAFGKMPHAGDPGGRAEGVATRAAPAPSYCSRVRSPRGGAACSAASTSCSGAIAGRRGRAGDHVPADEGAEPDGSSS